MKPVYILAAILIFGVLIALHELGHFLTAKLCGVRVNEFSIGMGPLVFQRERGDTLYSLRLFPIGGYCAMEGENEDTGDARCFVRQGFWKQFLILSAGSIMNFLTGVIVVCFLFSGADAFYVDQVAGLAPEFDRTGEDGLMEGDRFYKVDGYRTYLAGDAAMFLSYAGETVDIEVVRDGRHILLEDVPRQTCTSTDGTTYQGIGIYVSRYGVPATLGVRLQYTWYQVIDFVQSVWFSLSQLFTGNAGIQDFSGPVGIVSTMTEVGEASATVGAAIKSIAYFAALVAVNLAVMNLLPIPALDGGRIFFLLVDALCMMAFRRKIPEHCQAAVHTAGFVVLLGFMLLVTFQDVFRLFQ